MAMMINIVGTCIVRDEPGNEEVWPTIFACRPNIGDIVCSKSGRELAIVGLKHAAVSEERDGQTWSVPKLTILLA